MTDRFKRAAALGAAAVALTSGALFGAVGSASAAPNHHPGPEHGRQHCSVGRGYWTQTWIPGRWDHRHWRPAHAQRVWHPGHRDCRR
ncbi:MULTISPECIES: hypothetical protein [unclassified Streptomyces]|uniref:hypothetical protein n=1 Tax=unclassified Streptomyces TaxID=2593676 RepID=UPI0033BDC27D